MLITTFQPDIKLPLKWEKELQFLVKVYTLTYLMTVILCYFQPAHACFSSPSMFGFSGVGPGAGGGDVRVWNGAVLHPQGVPTLSCKQNDWREGRNGIKL